MKSWKQQVRDRLREDIARGKDNIMTPVQLEEWIKAAESLGVTIIVGPRPEVAHGT